MEGRTQKSVRNMAFAAGGQIFSSVASIVARWAFLFFLNEQYLGLSSLFSSVLTILSIVELGVGPALSYSLYKPIAENDIEKIKSLMNLYKKAYRIIGGIILGLGLLLIIPNPFAGGVPTYQLVINPQDLASITDPNSPTYIPESLTLIFYLYVLNTGISYFYSYKKSILICDQNQYITTIYHYVFFIALQLVQIAVLAVTQNFYLFLILQIIFTWLENFAISYKADKKYPYLKEKNIEPIGKEDFKGLKKNIGAMIIHKVVGAGVTTAPSLFISYYVDLVKVGFYNNYYLITNAIQTVLARFFEAIVASIGNLNASKDNGRMTLVHNRLFFMNFWFYGFSSIALATLFNQFISIWVGADKTFTEAEVLLIVISFYVYGMRRTLFAFKDATGTFWNDRYRPIAELAINLATSFMAVNILPDEYILLGILSANIISTLLTAWVEPLVVYKHVLHEKLIKFFARYSIYTAATILTFLATNYLTKFIDGLLPTAIIGSNWIFFIVNCIIVVIISNLMFLLMFMFTPEFKYYWNLFLRRKTS